MRQRTRRCCAFWWRTRQERSPRGRNRCSACHSATRSRGIRWCSRSSACLIREALEHREARLCLGQQNAKSAIVAVCLLARLVGPLRVSGWLGGVCSINKGKAAELKEQTEMIAIASGLRDLAFRRSPASGRVTLNADAHPSATRLASMTPWSMSWGCWPSAPDPW